MYIEKLFEFFQTALKIKGDKMKIIGVTGKSGAGKTTFASFLGERKNVGVIHIDNIMNNIKEEKFKSQIKGRTKSNAPILLSSKVRMFLSSYKIPFKIYMAIKRKMMKSKIENQIKEFKREGKDAVIIEGVHLPYLVDSKLFSKTIYVRRSYIDRKRALRKRENLSKRDIIERDLPYKRKLSTTNEKDFDYVIENNLGKEELKAASNKIYDEIVGIKTFDERYRILSNPLPYLKNIVITVNKTAKNNIIKRSYNDK